MFTFYHLKPKTEVVSIFIFTSTPCILHPPQCCRKMLNRLEWLSSKNSQLDPVQSLNSWWSHGIGTADPAQTMRKTWMRMVYVTCINSKKKKKPLDKNIHYYSVFTPCEFCFWLSLHSPLPHSVLTLTLMRKISPILDHLCCEGGGRGGRAGKHSNPSQYD